MGAAGPLEREGCLTEFLAGMGGGGLGEGVRHLSCCCDLGCCGAVVAVVGDQEGLPCSCGGATPCEGRA
ncbi:hypothetical protein [Streptomyces coelicoflavus]|uniref:hypothetical protein n=1 Tax=Streptomyces coelicoflavus TaxID=285562 RepID=UPI0036351360